MRQEYTDFRTSPPNQADFERKPVEDCLNDLFRYNGFNDWTMTLGMSHHKTVRIASFVPPNFCGNVDSILICRQPSGDWMMFEQFTANKENPKPHLMHVELSQFSANIPVARIRRSGRKMELEVRFGCTEYEAIRIPMGENFCVEYHFLDHHRNPAFDEKEFEANRKVPMSVSGYREEKKDLQNEQNNKEVE